MKSLNAKMDTLVELVKGPEIPDAKEIRGLTPMVTHMWQSLFIGRDSIEGRVRSLWEDKLKLTGVCLVIGGVGAGVVELVVQLVVKH